MQRLFLFLYQYRAFILFVFLEALCAWLIIQNNQYQSAAFFNSSNRYAASVLKASNDISDYFSLKQVNNQLAEENAILRQKITNLEVPRNAGLNYLDSGFLEQYDIVDAKVINNSINRTNNYITVDRGSLDGIKPGMGVVTRAGVVGKVKSVSNHFATIISVLHTDGYISSVIKGSGTFGSIKWEGRDSKSASLLFVPRHLKIDKGDTVVSSGFNSIYPYGIMIGTINEIGIKGNAAFYDIGIELSTDFNNLSYVYIIDNKLQQERDSLELKIGKQ